MSSELSQTLGSHKEIVDELHESGIFLANLAGKIDCDLVCARFQRLINQGNINHPRKPIAQIKAMDEVELQQFHATIGDAENKISQEDFASGEHIWRDFVPFVTVKHPLQQIPEIITFVLD